MSSVGAMMNVTTSLASVADTPAFKAVTYVGTSPTSKSVTGVGFSPDLVWAKDRDSTSSHAIFDTVRGIKERLRSDTTGGEVTQNGVTSFDADGFTVGDNNGANRASNDFIAWCWKAGGAPTSSNSATNGSAMVDGVATTTASIASAASASITPTKMSVNTEAGFSIVQYDGTGANATVPHGLSQTPECVFVKNTIDATNWGVYHADMDANPEQKRLLLNEPDGKTDTSTPWNDTSPNSSVLTLGTSHGSNGTNDSIIAYCWHSVPGFSQIGGYTGTGATGHKITTNFQPAFVMIKRADTTGDWVIVDNTRNVTNPRNRRLFPNENFTESTTSNTMNFDADGFTLTVGSGYANAANGTYIYLAFAEYY